MDEGEVGLAWTPEWNDSNGLWHMDGTRSRRCERGEVARGIATRLKVDQMLLLARAMRAYGATGEDEGELVRTRESGERSASCACWVWLFCEP